MKSTQTSSRKKEHVDITVSRDVSFHSKTAGFEKWDFVHNALPELNLSEVDCSTHFLGKQVSLPLLVSSMTGGYGEALRINRQLAEVCEEMRLGLGVGSQRQALEETRFHRSFSVVREAAPSIPIFGNIGSAEVARMREISPIKRLVEMINADGFAVHLNPLQEFLQPEGNTDFRGVLEGIGRLVRELGVPIIVKEIGAGISAGVARKLVDEGVKIIDVAGAGGTSWAGVEIVRRTGAQGRKARTARGKTSAASVFWEWGIPTVEALMDIAPIKKDIPELRVVASGGITSGIDIAKSIALGADLAGSARPLIQALRQGGTNRLKRLIEEWKWQLRGVMFLTGSRTVGDLQSQPLRRQT
ncbi:MAG: type 2 isopentenyl-diphosphate Delta-isomerase [Ignavibacteria bacterium]|nr:type 2 isopentenyl-diphosphate Delta-isomerase [Ignavibacteria bacterium]